MSGAFRIRKIHVACILAALAAACGSPPTIRFLELDQRPSPMVPLAGQVMAETDRPTALRVRIEDGEHRWEIGPDAMSQRHAVVLAGLRPGRSHTVYVEVTDAAGRSAAYTPLAMETPPLPENFPPIDAGSGWRLVASLRQAEPDTWNPGPLVILDPEGTVVWYCFLDNVAIDPQRDPDGNIRYTDLTGRIRTIDILGNEVAIEAGTGPATLNPDTLVPLGDGWYLSEARPLAGAFP